MARHAHRDHHHHVGGIVIEPTIGSPFMPMYWGPYQYGSTIFAIIVVTIIIVIVLFIAADTKNYSNGSYVSRPGDPYTLDPSPNQGSFVASETLNTTAVSPWLGCSGPKCYIRDKTKPRQHVYNDAASWYVYGPQNPPFVAWLRQQQIVANSDAIQTYLDDSIWNNQQPWGPRNNLMRNRR